MILRSELRKAALASVLCLGLAACSGSPAPETAGAPEETAAETAAAAEDGAEAEEETYARVRVCIVCPGNLGDGSINDSCNMGAQKAARDFGIELDSLEGRTADEWKANVLAACDSGYDLVIGVSPQIAGYIAEYAPEYPDTRFAVIDGTADLPNAMSVSFAQDEGFFLAGAAAAMFTQKTGIDGINEENTIGWVGGTDSPELRGLYSCYEQGAKYIDPDIRILQSFADVPEDPAMGKELALAQYDGGADIVMNAAFTDGTGILEAAKEAGRYAVGSGTDQDSVQPGSVLTSVVKHYDSACYLVIRSAADGTFEGGTKLRTGLSDGGISLTDFSVMRKALGDRFPQDIPEKAEELKEKIISGEIPAGYQNGK